MWFYYRLLVAPTDLAESLQLPFINIFNIQFQHVINWSLHSVRSDVQFIISDYYTCFYACSVMLYFSFTLSYMLSTFQVLMHTCATSSRDVGSGS